MKKIKLMLLCFIITVSMLICIVSCINPVGGSDNITKKEKKKNSGKKTTGYKYDIKTEKGLIATINDKEEYDRIMNESGKNSASTETISPAIATGSILGDVNNNGVVDFDDALFIAKVSVGLEVPIFNNNVADVNGDSLINIVDALLVAQFSEGIISEFPVERLQNVIISGRAQQFVAGNGGISKATISILGKPSEFSETTNGDNDADKGYFKINTQLRIGDQFTLVFERDDSYYPYYSQVMTYKGENIENVVIHAPKNGMIDNMIAVFKYRGIIVDKINKAHLSATVSINGGSILNTVGNHGVSGATVKIYKAATNTELNIPAYYFKIVKSGDIETFFGANPGDVIPDPTLTATTEDGGIIFVNLDEGEYILRAFKSGSIFKEVKAVCKNGVLTNAAPPYSLEEQ